MSLSCSYDDSGEGWYYMPPDDFTPFDRPKRKRCCSCKELINVGTLALKFECFRYPQNEIEERIHGDGAEIPLADKYLCEKCGDQYFNLSEVGFNIDITENIMDSLKEYQEEYSKPMRAA